MMVFAMKLACHGERIIDPELLSNRPQALSRLVKIKKALNRDPVKEEMYKEAMQQYF